jgi:Fe2+ or Zn2+ uptake regulation protein
MEAPSSAELHKTIRAHGLRPSVPRVAIYQFLVTHPIHPTVDDIYSALRPKMRTLSRTTVYNVLHSFVEQGLADKVHSEDLELRYDANVTPHAHFKCLKCGKVYDFAETPCEALLPYAKVPEGFDPMSVSFIIRGMCPDCK